MSLATSTGISMGGGGGAAGLAIAHQAGQVGRIAPPQAPPQAEAPGTAGGPPSGAILGADLIDKQQVSLKKAKDTAHLPLVAVDLCAKDKTIAYYPPKPENPEDGKLPATVGSLSPLALKTTEDAHKTLRKFLNQSKTYAQLREDAIATGKDKSIVIAKPEKYLGMRRSEKAQSVDDGAISEESTEVGITLVNSTLDGSPSKNDDFDRVVLKARLVSSKKTITILPEEAVQISLHDAQYQVSQKVEDAPEDEVEDYPLSVAVPSWMMNDPMMEALNDATDHAGVFFPRSVCALAAILLPDPGAPNPVHGRIVEVLKERSEQHKIDKADNPNAHFEEEIMIVLAGMTEDSVECTAIQIYTPQKPVCCQFGDFKVISSVSKRCDNPEKELIPCLRELRSCIDDIAPEAAGPALMSLYGTADEVKSLKNELNGRPFWKKVPVFEGKSDDVAKGAAVMGAVSHGRVCVLVPKGPNGKSRADLAIRLQSAAPVAIGMRINYFDDDSKWEEIKPVFDFDRRTPAGPYTVELKASECILHREGKVNLSDEDHLKAIKTNESAKYIPDREKAARALKVEIYQKLTRNEEWQKLGDTLQPLLKADPDKEGSKIACESVSLQISLGVTGLVSTALEGDRQSVAQATKSARNSALRYYLGIGFLICFLGYFLVRSYLEEYVLERDAKKLLVYYKHVVPGSISDGDKRNAMYLAYKYRHKKDKLWANLEKKYGVPIREVDEWEGYGAEEETETVNLDDEQQDEDTNDENGEKDEF